MRAVESSVWSTGPTVRTPVPRRAPKIVWRSSAPYAPRRYRCWQVRTSMRCGRFTAQRTVTQVREKRKSHAVAYLDVEKYWGRPTVPSVSSAEKRYASLRDRNYRIDLRPVFFRGTGILMAVYGVAYRCASSTAIRTLTPVPVDEGHWLVLPRVGSPREAALKPGLRACLAAGLRHQDPPITAVEVVPLSVPPRALERGEGGPAGATQGGSRIPRTAWPARRRGGDGRRREAGAARSGGRWWI
jgi:hypothetical protein